MNAPAITTPPTDLRPSVDITITLDVTDAKGDTVATLTFRTALPPRESTAGYLTGLARRIADLADSARESFVADPSEAP